MKLDSLPSSQISRNQVKVHLLLVKREACKIEKSTVREKAKFEVATFFSFSLVPTDSGSRMSGK